MLSISDLKELKRTTKLKIKADGTLVLTQYRFKKKEEISEILLSDLQVLLEEKYQPFLLSFFMDEEIEIEKELTVFSLLSGLQHWYNYLNVIYGKSFESYLEHFRNVNERHGSSLTILISRQFELKKERKYEKGFSPLHFLIQNQGCSISELDKYEVKTNEHSLLNRQKIMIEEKFPDGRISHIYTDPCDQVDYLKDACFKFDDIDKIFLPEHIVNCDNEDLTIVNDSNEFYMKSDMKYYHLPIKNGVKLRYLLSVLDYLLYFHHPISQEKQQKNAAAFMERIENMETNLDYKEVSLYSFLVDILKEKKS